MQKEPEATGHMTVGNQRVENVCVQLAFFILTRTQGQAMALLKFSYRVSTSANLISITSHRQPRS